MSSQETEKRLEAMEKLLQSLLLVLEREGVLLPEELEEERVAVFKEV